MLLFALESPPGPAALLHVDSDCIQDGGIEQGDVRVFLRVTMVLTEQQPYEGMLKHAPGVSEGYRRRTGRGMRFCAERIFVMVSRANIVLL